MINAPWFGSSWYMNLTFLPSSNVLNHSSSDLLVDSQSTSSSAILLRVSQLSQLIAIAVAVGSNGNLNEAALLEPHIIAVFVG